MLSGVQTLRNIDSTLKSVKNEIHRIDAELSILSNQLADNRRQQGMIILELAKVRLGALTEGSIIDRISSADKRALVLLEKRQEAFKKLESDIDSQQIKQQQLEQLRQELLEKNNQIAQQLAEKEARVQAELIENDEYQTALQRAREADGVADEAERKAQESADSLDEKGKPYQNDELFMYLWNRRYGTTDYKNHNPLTRMLDSWVARLAKYNDNRANYWNIQEIPKRLEQHAQNIRDQADALITDIQVIEKAFLEKAGAHDIKQALENAQHEIENCDADIDQAEQQENSLLNTRAQFASAQDPHMQESLNVLRDALQHQNLTGLSQLVAATPSYEDDDLLKDLHQYQSTFHSIKEDINDLRRAHDEKLRRLQELETVRKNFKRHRYDDVRSGFGNDALISNVLGHFLEGLVSGAEVWRVLQRNQRHQDVGAWPDFGSGGLGTSRRRRGNIHGNVLNDIFGNQHQRSSRKGRAGSPWHWPDSSNGGFQLPGGRSRGSSDGFKTGGGF